MGTSSERLAQLESVALALAALVGGIVLRLARLGSQRLSTDEAFSWAATRLPFTGVVNLVRYDFHPPLYHLLLKTMLVVLPASESGLRFLSLICSVATLAAILLLVRKEWGARAAAYALALMALSPLDIFYAQETRMYALLSFLWVLSCILLPGALAGRRRALLGWSVACVALAWTHAYGLMGAGIEVALFAWHGLLRPPGANAAAGHRGRVGAALAMVLAGMIPVVLLIWLRKGDLKGAGGPILATPEVLPTLFKFWVAGPLPFKAENLPAGTGLDSLLLIRERTIVATMALVGAAFLAGLIKLWKRDDAARRFGGTVLALTLGPMALVYAASAGSQQRFWLYRGFVGCGALLLATAGIGIAELPQRSLRLALLAAILALDAMSLLPYYTIWQKNPGAAALASFPRQDARTVILVTPYWHGLDAFYYLGPDAHVWGWDQEPRQLSRLIPAGSSVPAIVESGCESPALQGFRDVYLYGPEAWSSPEPPMDLPACLAAKRLWMFDRDRWRMVRERAMGGT